MVSCYLLLATCYLLLATCYLLLASCYLLLATCYLLLATCYLLLATCYLLLATCRSHGVRRLQARPRALDPDQRQQLRHLRPVELAGERRAQRLEQRPSIDRERLPQRLAHG